MKPNRIAWHIAVPPEVTTEYAGTEMGAYYTDWEVMLRTQSVARQIFKEKFGIEIGGERIDVPAYLGVGAFGAEIVYPEDDMPQVRGVLLRRAEDVTQLRMPESFYDTPAARPAWEMYQTMLARGRRLPLGTGIEGPVTSAKLLRGEEFFLDLYDHPRAAHRLLDLMTESFLAFVRENRRRQGLPETATSAGIADDFAGLISPEMWPEFVVPYYRRIYEGATSRSHHSELLRPGHLKHLLDLGVTSFDPGQDQYLTIQAIREAAPGLRFTWNLFTVRDMKEGTPDSIKRIYRQAVHHGATAIMAELCRGTPEQNIHAFIEVAKEFT
jgi:uroporphyrinogen decarboxylase